MTKLLVVVSAGVLLSAGTLVSVTLMVIVFVLGCCAVVVFHVNTPLVEFRFRFVKVVGGEIKANSGVPLVGRRVT